MSTKPSSRGRSSLDRDSTRVKRLHGVFSSYKRNVLQRFRIHYCNVSKLISARSYILLRNRRVPISNSPNEMARGRNFLIRYRLFLIVFNPTQALAFTHTISKSSFSSSIGIGASYVRTFATRSYRFYPSKLPPMNQRYNRGPSYVFLPLLNERWRTQMRVPCSLRQPFGTQSGRMRSVVQMSHLSHGQPVILPASFYRSRNRCSVRLVFWQR